MATKPQIVGAPISKEVVEQIKYRAGVLKTVVDRTPEEMLYMNGSTAFVRLISGVGTTDAALDEKRRQAASTIFKLAGTFSYNDFDETNKAVINQYVYSDLASKNILHGGSSKLDEIKTGFNLVSKRSGVALTPENNDSAAYQLYNDKNGLGFRPTPGITSMNITAYNRYGTLRKATVRFNCWSAEQLDVMEKLYMRPGYTMLLEWGHTYFINSEGQFEQRVSTLVNEFFKGSTPKAIQEKIQVLKTDSGFNYDGFLGRVTNFSWTYRQDGGYDCSIDLVTQGEIIESVQALISPDIATINKLKTGESTISDTIRLNPSTLHILLTVISNWPNNDITSLQDRINTIWPYQGESLGFENLANNIIFSRSFENIGALKYLKLRDLLKMINVFIFRKTRTTDITSFGIDDSVRVNTYNTFEGHFSGNPGIALIDTTTSGVLPSATQSSTNSNTGNILFLNTNTAFGTGNISTNVLDIYVNVSFVLSVLENMIEARAKKDSKTFVYDFIKDVLNGVSQALGDINELDISYDDDELVWYVIDRNLPINLQDKETVRLNLTGLSSSTTQINLTTQLSSELSSMMAIGAGAGGAELSSTLEGFFRFNKGYIDRLYPDPNILYKQDANNTGKWKDYSTKLTLIQDTFTPYVQGTSFNSETFNSVSVAHQEWTNYTFRLKQGNSRNEQKAAAYSGIIPFKLQITLEGISGIRILEAFTINKGILPPRYDDLVAFVATGLEHKVENNRWFTIINAQMFIPPDTELKKEPQDNGQISISTPETGDTVGAISTDLPNTTNPDLWTLVAICAAENFRDNPQGMADVAQSIYNRLAAGGYGSSLKSIITSPNQYEPTFKNPGDWNAIVDAKTAIVAYKNSRGVKLNAATQVIESAYNAITNEGLRAKAKSHVGSRTEFLAANPTSSEAIGVVVRTPDRKNNNFYWRYRGKDVFYNKGIVDARPTPPGIVT